MEGETLTVNQIQKEQNLTLIVIAVMLGVFLAGIDAMVVGTAMPTVVGELGGLHLYSWVFSAYMLTTAVFMPLFGKLSDLFGRKSMFYAAIGFFLLGSITSGLSQTMLQLVLFRVIQGIGSGGMAAVPFSIIGSVFPPEKRGRAFGFIAAVWGISSIVGPALGSFIVTHLSWRWVFYVNIPFGVASIILITLFYHQERNQSSVSVDVLGAFSLGSAITALLLAFFEIGKGSSIFSSYVFLMLILFVLIMALFLSVERRAKDPILPLQFFKKRVFSVCNLCGFLGGFAIFGSIAYMPLFIQSVQGGSPMKVALVLTPMSLGWSLAAILGGQLFHKFGEKRIVLIGMLSMATGFFLAFFIRYDSSVEYLILCVTIIGMAMGIQTPALLTAVQNSLHKSVLGVATSSQMLARTLGGTIGASLMGATLTHSMQSEFTDLLQSGVLTKLPETVQSHLNEPHELLSAQVRAVLSPDLLNIILSAFTHALHNVFIIGFVVAFIGVLLSLLLPKAAVS